MAAKGKAQNREHKRSACQACLAYVDLTRYLSTRYTDLQGPRSFVQRGCTIPEARRRYIMSLRDKIMSPRHKLASCLAAAILLMPSMQAAAQEAPDRTLRVETVDGSVFTGRLVHEDEETIVLLTESLGEITLRRENIRSMTEIEPSRVRDDGYWFENPQSTRYFFAPNAIGIRPGTGYYQNAWILFNNVNWGVTDYFSIGAGAMPLFLFGTSTPIWVLPKVAFELAPGRAYVGAGAMLGGIVGEDPYSAGLLYGVVTVGDRDRNATVGLGYGYGGGEISSTPVINVSGMARLSRTMYVVSENYFFSDADDVSGLLSIGLRWARESVAVDFGLFRPLADTDELIAVPWLGVTLPIGGG